MKKHTVKTLDNINPIWLLKQISAGNLIRGINWLGRILKPVKNCLVPTTRNIKENITAAKQEIAAEDNK